MQVEQEAQKLPRNEGGNDPVQLAIDAIMRLRDANVPFDVDRMNTDIVELARLRPNLSIAPNCYLNGSDSALQQDLAPLRPAD